MTNITCPWTIERGVKAEAAKRRKIAVQGACPGFRRKHTKPRRGERNLIPNVTFVVRDVILLQERHKLLLKRMLLMVFVLSCDVLGDCRNV